MDHSLQPAGVYQIVRVLPQERGINQYRIKAMLGDEERVVVEAQLEYSL